ncbi:hypothetical protein [Cribrihabitans neustonicus]|uniref:hypothetical protein n=1 Tax=Cribrihabitans neustonicus TaxID=1429085 RepID=UPI003B59446F
MGEDRHQFQARLAQLNRKHAAMAQGCSTQMRADGLIVVKPEPPRRRGPGVLRLLVFAAGGVVLFKGLLMAVLGQATYAERVAGLTKGNLLEQAGAVVMRRDPLSDYLAGKIMPVLR